MGIQQMLMAGAAAVAPIFNLLNAIRLSKANSAFFNRTFGAPTANLTWTFSAWVQRGEINASQTFCIFGAGTQQISFENNALRLLSASGSVPTTQQFRDPTAHGHLCVVSNGTNIQLFWNNNLLQTYTGSMSGINSATDHTIGKYGSGGNQFDGVLSDMYFVDGQALTPGAFAAAGADGVWRPKAYAGTYGNNGFHLEFKDASAATAAAIGKDTSGRGNNFTPNAISVTVGPTMDQLTDTPTDNHSCLNYVQPTSPNTITMGGYRNNSAGASFLNSVSSIPITGKRYWEATQGAAGSGSSNNFFGVINADKVVAGRMDTSVNTSGLICGTNSQAYDNSTNKFNVGTAFTPGEIVKCAFDAATGNMWIGRGAVWYNSTGGTDGDPANGLNPTFVKTTTDKWLAVAHSYANFLDFNFGQRAFAYTPPTGFSTLSTKSMQPPAAPATSGTFTGNANADGPVVWTGGVPTTLTINGNAVTFGTHADRLAGGFKVRNASATYNAAGANNWVATYNATPANSAFAQPQPAQSNP